MKTAANTNRNRIAAIIMVAAIVPASAYCHAASFSPTLQGATHPARPSGCVELPARANVQNAIETAPLGSTLCLAPGAYAGPIVVDRAITIWGPPEAVVRSNGKGHTIDVRADNARILGLTIEGSGRRYDTMDAGLHVTGNGVRVEGVTVRDALFGITFERTENAVVRGNYVVGDPNTPMGLRGDGIRLWSSRGAIADGNLVEDSRDMLAWFSPNSRITNNVVRRSRYATHFMYSSGALVEGNQYVNNTVGVFVMYSDGIVIAHNLLAGNSSSDGLGVGGKESDLSLTDNVIVQDTTGLYLDSCPFHPGRTDTISGNLFALCDSAMVFLASGAHNRFFDNTLRDNQFQVRTENRGDLMNAEWARNYFDDYQGYDLDGDGFGDVPYELRSLSGELIGEYPALAFFRGTSALGMIDAASNLFPLFQPQPLLVDRRPRMRPAGTGAAG